MRIDHLLDLMENPSRPTTVAVMSALLAFLKNLEAELGESHPVVVQVRKALCLPPRSGSMVGVFKNPGVRIN